MSFSSRSREYSSTTTTSGSRQGQQAQKMAMEMAGSKGPESPGGVMTDFPEEFKMIATDMPESEQLEILSIVSEAASRTDKQKEIAKMIKQELDTKLERLWHVVIVVGQYWNFVSHEPGHCFNFKLGRNLYLIWRTPGY